MTWFLGLFCLCVFVGCLYGMLHDYPFSVGEFFAAAVLSACATFVSWILGMMIISGIYFCVEDNLDKAEISANSTEIIALKDTSNTYIGRGYHDEEFVYVYMAPTANGKQLRTVAAEDCYILEVPTGEYPTIVEHEMKFESAVARFFFGSPSPYYTIYLPETAIIEELTYEIDLE